MRILSLCLFFMMSLNVVAQDKQEEKTETTLEKQEETTIQKESQEEEIEVGPYKDGQYQFFGEKQRKERDERLERQQQ